MTVGACGGGSDSVAVAEIGPELSGVTCERMFECCTAEELMTQLGFFDADTVEECTTVFTGFISGLLTPQIEDAIASGRMIYHADRMGACIDTLRSLPCDQLAESMSNESIPVVGCDDPFEGQVADGDACAADFECQSGNCNGESMDFEGNVTEGTCGAPPAIGDACDFECASGAFCEFGPDGSTCQATLSPGSECTSGDECSTEVCEGADPDNGVPGTCSADFACDGQ